MKKVNFLLSVLISTFLFLACSSLGSKTGSKQFDLRPVQEKTLTNGLRILYIPDHSLPRISYHLLIQSGSAEDPKGLEGLSALTVSLLEKGTKNKGALQIADDFAQLGSSFVEAASSDYVMMTTTGLSQYKEQLLKLYSDVVLHPAFAEAEVKREKSQVLAELTQLPDRPSEYASLLFEKELFGQHPYAHPVNGRIQSVKAIKRSQVQNHYSSLYRPGNAILAVAGNFDDAFKATVEKTFSGWKPGKVIPFQVPVPTPLKEKDFTLFTKEGLQQTQIRIGQFGIPRNHPDFLALRMANIVLGGAFASRLNQKVRDDLGLTYSIHSNFEALQSTGSFKVSTFARNEKVGEAIKATFQVIEDFKKNGITEKELKASKALLIGQFPAAIETVDRLAFNLMALRLYGVPDTYLTEFFNNVSSIKLSEVNSAIQKHFHPELMKVVVFADEKAVKNQLAELGNFQVEKAQ